jgi:hypothetical protein
VVEVLEIGYVENDLPYQRQQRSLLALLMRDGLYHLPAADGLPLVWLRMPDWQPHRQDYCRWQRTLNKGIISMSAYDDFQQDFLNANTWAQRKDGLPLDLLDALSDAEKLTAEEELLHRVENDDPWVIQGLAHLKSARALERLRPLLNLKTGLMQVHIATAIYELSGDLSMERIVADFVANENNHWAVKIDAIYCLAKFKTESARVVLHRLESDKEHLIVYNAKRVLGVKQ